MQYDRSLQDHVVHITRSVHYLKKKKQKDLITASAGNHAQGVALAAKHQGCQGNDRYANNHSTDQRLIRTKELWSRSDPSWRCL